VAGYREPSKGLARMSTNNQETQNDSPESLGKLWRHPTHRDIELPYKVAAAVVLMGMGVTDFLAIAALVGLTEEDVESVDSAEDPTIRKLASVGVPGGDGFKIRGPVRCPKCHANISIVPCVTCGSATGF
jgi:hypothetical protein